MAKIFISVGSNIEREKNLRAAVARMQVRFGELRMSPVYESVAVGFVGDNFYNLVVGAETPLPVREVVDELHRIEAHQGRARQSDRNMARTLDLDLLTYDDAVLREDEVRVPRDEIEKYAFVLRPLADIAPHERHPLLQCTYAELWKEFRATGQRLWPVHFTW